METNENFSLLTNLCKNEDWFHSLAVDEFNRMIVYTKYMSLDVYNYVPDELNEQKILVHFAQSVLANKDRYKEEIGSPFSGESAPPVPVSVPVTELILELEKLEKICGSNILQDIFFEVHDGENAVTNLSDRYPEVRKPMDKLYTTYGFDAIYNELDG